MHFVIYLDVDQFTLVALGSGCKVSNTLLTHSSGISVLDSHAEVICVRALRRFLYDQMLLALQNPTRQEHTDAETPLCIVERPVDEKEKPFRVKKDVRFHFCKTFFLKKNKTNKQSKALQLNCILLR